MNHKQKATAMAAVLALAFLGTGVPQVNAGDDIDSLPAEQAAFANRFLDFLERMDDTAFSRAAEMNGTDDNEALTMDTDSASYDIRVARGPVVEKIGRTRSIVWKATERFERERPAIWGRYFLIDIHPKSPLVGMLHATIVANFYDDGTSTIAGFLDVLRTAHHEEDLAYMRDAMDEVFEKYEVDATPYRRLSDDGFDEDDPLYMDGSKWRKTEEVGGNFYGGRLFSVNEENFNFLTEAYEAMLDAYLTVVERRARTPYTEADLAAQDRMRKNWLEDRFFADPYTSTRTPYNAWSLYSLPPTVKF